MKDSYTITNIDETRGHIIVTFNVDGEEIEKRIGDAPYTSKEDLHRFMCEYIKAYKRGVEETTKMVPQEVEELIDEEVVIE
jgi:hypothetical protein